MGTEWLFFLVFGVVTGFLAGSFMAAVRSGKPPPEHLRTYRMGAPWYPSAWKWGLAWSAVYGVLLPIAFVCGGPDAATVMFMFLLVALVGVVVSAESRHWRP